MIEIGTAGAPANPVYPSADASRHRLARRILRSHMSRGFGSGRWLNAVVFSVAGFILGAVFWHFVGFWSFVSHVVLTGPSGSVAGVVRKDPGRNTQVTKEQVIKEPGRLRDGARAIVPLVSTLAPEVEDCVTLALDRRSGRTDLLPCRRLPRELPLSDASSRGDLAAITAPAATAATWSVQVDATDTPAPPPSR